MAHVLIVRISALSDVAMAIPVIYSVAEANCNHSFTVVTHSFIRPVFINCPSNLTVIGIQTRGREKTLNGLLKFTLILLRQNYDIVIDLQNVLRTRIIGFFFKLRGKRVFIIDKGRKEQATLTSHKNKKLRPLVSIEERYADVFLRAGINYTPSFTSLFEKQPANIQAMEAIIGRKCGKWIGIAPFAKYQGKVYPLEKMEYIIATLAKNKEYTIFLFGSRGQEEMIIENWIHHYPSVQSVVGHYTLDIELALISCLDIFLSMDSANMHFASLVNIPIISIWGATHPYLGYYGWKQSADNYIQLDLPCRPCSLYGEKVCLYKDWHCLTQISPEIIIKKIEETI